MGGNPSAQAVGGGGGGVDGMLRFGTLWLFVVVVDFFCLHP